MELPIVVPRGEVDLPGILHDPEGQVSTGVVIVVGGPQYRVGSHRQFVLLARSLATRGIAVLRFDHSGVGDSDGGPADFENLDADLRSAIDTLITKQPGLVNVCMWGLCDAASAIMMYAHRDPRVTHVVLVNPWVRDDNSLAAAQLRRYYFKSLFDARTLARLVTGKVNVLKAASGFIASMAAAAKRKSSALMSGAKKSASYQERMREGFANFAGQSLVIISGQDLTAAEFEQLSGTSRPWRQALSRATVQRQFLPNADHTFSRREWRDEVASITANWLDTSP